MIRQAVSALAILAAAPGLGRAASFPCARAHTASERAICADPALGNLDSRLVGLIDLDESTVAMGGRGAQQDEQTAWIRTRDACGADRACLLSRYRQRLDAVRGHLVLRLCGKAGPPC